MNNFTKDALEVGFWVCSVLILLGTIYAIYFGPIKAVQIGRSLDNESDKKDAKLDLFLTLFSYRGSPVHVEFVNALNQIEIIFQDDPKVLTAWHIYYDSLQLGPSVTFESTLVQRIQLLSVMAVSLGYNELQQTDIMKHYYPAGHQAQIDEYYNMQAAQLDYYSSGAHLYRMLIEKEVALNSETQKQ